MLARLLINAGKVVDRLHMYLYLPLFAKHGCRVRFDPHGVYTYSTITLGDDVTLGWRPVVIAAKSRITIGNKVMFGPEVMVIGGVHNTSVMGRYMFDVTEKRPEDDRDVVIEDDVWIGSRAIILHGVTIGRGAIVGAGAIVTRSVPPYAVVAGVPARVLKFRWDVDTILRHEVMLYPVEKRLALERLQADRDLRDRAS